VIEVPVPVTWATGAGTSPPSLTEVESTRGDTPLGWAMAGIETAVEAARRYIIKRPRLTRLLDNANARVLMLIAPAGFGKTTLAREWVADRPHVWYRGTPATADVAALAARFAETISEVIPNAGARAVNRMRATGTPEDDVAIIADLFAEDLTDWPADTWLVFDDYQFAMEAKAPERFVDLLLRNSPIRLLLASRKRPTWASARRLLYGELYELGRNELAMDHDEAASVLAHRKDAAAAGLVALAEGWPAVIGLAALTEEIALPEGGLPDALYDYFAEELYQAASPVVKEGLCKLALAPSLAEGVAEFLLGDDAPEVISEGMRLGFLSTRSANLELHPLLRTFLDSKTRERTADSVKCAEHLARHFADSGAWDDAFYLVKHFFDEELFIDLFENGLQAMVAQARLPTIARWLTLAEEHRIDDPLVDLAGSEVSFHHGDRPKAEALALRATLRLEEVHSLRSHAFNIAAMSAHLTGENERARDHSRHALASAVNSSDRRTAVWSQLNASLDLELEEVDALMAELVSLHDGSALSEVRLALAQIQIGLRRGTIHQCCEALDNGNHVADRVTDPFALSAFLLAKALIPALRADYASSLREIRRCESYVREVRFLLALPYTKRIRAIAELGVRHFARCKQLLDWLDDEAYKTDNFFLEVEAKLIRARLFITQGLANRAVALLAEAPKKFPWEGERGEYLATQALALACADDCETALNTSMDAVAISDTVEVRALHECVAAIAAIRGGRPDGPARTVSAFHRVVEIGCLDSFVVTYRGYPEVLRVIWGDAAIRDQLIAIIDCAHDWPLAKDRGLRPPLKRSPRSSLSRREEEVLGLISHGLTNKEIAQALYITEGTAKLHVHHIFGKLGVRTRTEAALRASMEDDPVPEQP
jgi:LuxR family transcriptional regulator, maltose regulon positive regulatory protein